MKKFLFTFILGSLAIASPAHAQVVDGNRDAQYGAAKSTVLYNPAAPTSNFQAPTNMSNTTGYDIFLRGDANNVYGFFDLANPERSAGPFSNLYFDLDPANGNGSDLGFELTNLRAFVPGMGGYSSALSGINFAFGPSGDFEFSIANNLFTAPIAGLTYYNNQQFPKVGDNVVLRLSQSFGYSVAGGPTYGPDRLGAITIGGVQGAVPEPGVWAMMIVGFGAVGWALRRQRSRRHQFAAA